MLFDPAARYPRLEPVKLTRALGETWTFDVACYGPDGPLAASDLADVQFRMAKDAASSLDLVLGRGVAFLSAGDPNGAAIARISLEPTSQAGLTPGRRPYAVHAVTLAGEYYRQQFGDVAAMPSVFADFPPIAPVAPTGVFVSPGLAAAGAPAGSVIGELIGTTSNLQDRLTFSLVDGLSGQFDIANGNLVVGAAGIPASAVDDVLSPVVRVTNRAGLSFQGPTPVFVLSAGLLRGDLPTQSGLLFCLGIL